MATLDGRPMAKRLYLDPQGQVASDPANPKVKYFTGAQIPVGNFAELVLRLEAISLQPHMYIVRGTILPGVDPERMMRTHVNDPTLGAAEHHWILLDVDGYRPEVDAEVFAQNPGRYAQEARETLPDCFRRATCWWQATGSAGVKPGARIRLAFWLDKAIGDSEARAISSAFALPVDLSLFTPSQPHYVARPILDGVSDPCPGVRSGTLPGTPEVTLPATLPQDRRDAATKALESAVKRVRKAEEGERSNTLNACAFSLASRFAEDELSAERMELALLPAALSTGLLDAKAQTTFREAIGDGRRKHGQEREGWRASLARDENTDLPRGTAANTSIYLEHHPAFAGKLAYDERAHNCIWLESPPWGGPVPRVCSEVDTTRAIEWFQTQAHLDVKPQWVQAGLQKSAMEKTFDPIQDYLLALPEWDGQDRVDTFFIRHLGVEDTPLTRAQTRCWFIQAARRAFATKAKPVQADYLIVLCGEPGLRKSTTLRSLCPLPRFFRDNLPDLSRPDAALAISDSWIVELGELTPRKADRDVFKAFITRVIDKFRKPYGRDEIEAPRRAVLAGSSNEKEVLHDPTGNRRFWPFACTHRADGQAVVLERDLLWSEAYARAEAGEQAYLSDSLEADARVIQEAFREVDNVEEIMAQALSAPAPSEMGYGWTPDQLGHDRQLLAVTTSQAMELAGGSKLDQRYLSRVKAALRLLGWQERRPRVKTGPRTRLWYPPESWTYAPIEKADRRRDARFS